MEIYLGQKAKHTDLYNAKEVFEVVGITKTQESWVSRKGLIIQNMWGSWIDEENEIDFTKDVEQRDN